MLVIVELFLKERLHSAFDSRLFLPSSLPSSRLTLHAVDIAFAFAKTYSYVSRARMADAIGTKLATLFAACDKDNDNLVELGDLAEVLLKWSTC